MLINCLELNGFNCVHNGNDHSAPQKKATIENCNCLNYVLKINTQLGVSKGSDQIKDNL